MTPWRTEFEEDGGYDNMTHAWVIYNAEGRRVATIDLSDYGQEHCDYAFRSEAAEHDALLIVRAVNTLEGAAQR